MTEESRDATPSCPARSRRGGTREPLVQPFLKWVGGKRQLLPVLRPLMPKLSASGRYFEPFLGGGAVLFALQPSIAVVNDTNAELINCYEVVRDFPEELLEAVTVHENTSEHFYRVRDMDRSPKFNLMPPVERAARILYLNKTCFNGLFRVNSQGQFNVPFGSYDNPVFADPAVIRAVSRYLNTAQVAFSHVDYATVVANAVKGDFVYFDPPYDPVSDTSSFTGYNLNGFGRDDQRQLREVCDDLTRRGVKFLASNSDTPFIREQYSSELYQYTIETVQARRNVNSVGTRRGSINELVLMNYALQDEPILSSQMQEMAYPKSNHAP